MDIFRLKANFEDEEVHNIFSIPIPLFRKEDKVIWQFTKHGEYVVKSGYYLAREVLNSNQGMNSADPSPSLASNLSIFRKRIWNLNITNKLAHFLWHFLKDRLPSKDLLHRRFP